MHFAISRETHFAISREMALGIIHELPRGIMIGETGCVLVMADP
jgi:hypothetical protein